MRRWGIAAALVACAGPAVAAGPGGDAAPPPQGAATTVTAPVARNPLPPAILKKMRERLQERAGQAAPSPAADTPAGH